MLDQLSRLRLLRALHNHINVHQKSFIDKVLLLLHNRLFFKMIPVCLRETSYTYTIVLYFKEYINPLWQGTTSLWVLSVIINSRESVACRKYTENFYIPGCIQFNKKQKIYFSKGKKRIRGLKNQHIGT